MRRVEDEGVSGYKSKIARDRICGNCFWWTVRDPRDDQGTCDVESDARFGEDDFGEEVTCRDAHQGPMLTFRDDYCDEFEDERKRGIENEAPIRRTNQSHVSKSRARSSDDLAFGMVSWAEDG